jgi:hypothetical protein
MIQQWPGPGNETSIQQSELYSDALQILLFLNTQYIHHSIQNRLLVMLAREQGTCRVLGEYMVYSLNRQNDTNVLVQLHQLLVTVFSSPTTCRFFYKTDLQVIIDVLVRRLTNSDHVELVHSALHVWSPLLKNSQWRETKYGKIELVRVLQDIQAHSHNQESSRLASLVLEECHVLLQY